MLQLRVRSGNAVEFVAKIEWDGELENSDDCLCVVKEALKSPVGSLKKKKKKGSISIKEKGNLALKWWG